MHHASSHKGSSALTSAWRKVFGPSVIFYLPKYPTLLQLKGFRGSCFLLRVGTCMFLQDFHNLSELLLRPLNIGCLFFQRHVNADIQLVGSSLIATVVASLWWDPAWGLDVVHLCARTVTCFKCILLRPIESPRHLRFDRFRYVQTEKCLRVRYKTKFYCEIQWSRLLDGRYDSRLLQFT